MTWDAPGELLLLLLLRFAPIGFLFFAAAPLFFFFADDGAPLFTDLEGPEGLPPPLAARTPDRRIFAARPTVTFAPPPAIWGILECRHDSLTCGFRSTLSPPIPARL